VSRLEKALDQVRSERSTFGSAYEIRSPKEGGLSFVEYKSGHSKSGLIPIISVGRQVPSPADREWQAMEEEIIASEYLLMIENDLEFEDFVPYTRSTLARATQFLRRMMIYAHSANVVGMGVPRIGPADRGSIDVFWETQDRTLLINFPSSETIANYFGRKPKSEISGRFDPSEPRPELLFWLAD
jgi:hypothetical protein